MADFNSKYSGEQVEQLLDMVAGGNAGGGGGGGITVETDPVFSASPAATITEEQISDWNNAVNEITDIAEIREGATRGATALQYYVTTFDFGDLNSERDLFQEEVNKVHLVAAIRANKLILMPHDKTIPEIGFLVLACYVEDFLYIDFIYGRQAFHVETDVYNPDIYASEITVTTYATQDDIGNAGGGGGITVETDPVFLASPAASITEEKKSEWDNKQEAISDIDSIRSGAEKGTTSLQGSDTSEELDDVETNTYVKYTTQSLTEKQKEQARKNIGAVSQGELQKMYNKLLELIQGGVVTPTQAVLDEAVLDEAILS